jgi:hypothetical protein
LVAKIARCNRAMDIVREGWMYDELAPLQGVAIPRCYGVFSARLPTGFNVPVWGHRVAQFDHDPNGSPSLSFPMEYFGLPFAPQSGSDFPGLHPLAQHYIDARDEFVLILLERLEPCDPDPPLEYVGLTTSDSRADGCPAGRICILSLKNWHTYRSRSPMI